MSRNYFIFSLILQGVLGLLVVVSMILVTCRKFKKIQDVRFERKKVEEVTIKNLNKKTEKDMISEKPKDAPNLVYKFEAEQQDPEEQDEEEDSDPDETNASSDVSSQAEEPVIQDESADWYLNLDKKWTFFTPFVLVFVVCNNAFVCDMWIVVTASITIGLFLLFNMAGFGKSLKILQLLFIIPALYAAARFYLSSHDMSTA